MYKILYKFLKITISENDVHVSSSGKQTVVIHWSAGGGLGYYSAKTGQAVSASAAKGAAKKFSSGKAGEKL